jgi:hypothetical protein
MARADVVNQLTNNGGCRPFVKLQYVACLEDENFPSTRILRSIISNSEDGEYHYESTLYALLTCVSGEAIIIYYILLVFQTVTMKSQTRSAPHR